MVKFKRTTILAFVALASMLSACAGGTRSLPSVMNGQNSDLRPHAKPTSTTLYFVNKSSQPLTKVWFCYYGLDPNDGDASVYLANAAGLLKKTTANMPATNMCLKTSIKPSFVLPELKAARLYVSYGQPLTFTTGADMLPEPPNSALAKDRAYNTKWDFFEITYVPLARTTNGLFNVNLSVVQSANLNMQFTVKGLIPGRKTPVTYTRGWLPGGEAAFVKQILANPLYAKLVLPGTQRVLAPGTAVKAFALNQIPKSLFPANFYNPVVNQAWVKFQTSTLTFIGDPPPESQKKLTWTGNVVNGRFVFTPQQNTGLGLVKMAWKKPSTQSIFENDFNFCVAGCGRPDTLQKNYANQINGTMMAVFARAMLLKATTFTNGPEGAWCNRNLWYQGPKANYYSSYAHSNSIKGLAYAFQSDDHCNDSSFESVDNPDYFTITLQNP